VVGFEAQNGAAEEMRNPRRDVPVSVAVSGTISALCYLVPIFGITAVLPASQISGATGFLDAVATVFGVHGPAARPLLHLTAALFIFVLLNQGSAWMIASDRVQAIAGADGTFPRFFGVFHRRLGTPVRVNLLSGVMAAAPTLPGAGPALPHPRRPGRAVGVCDADLRPGGAGFVDLGVPWHNRSGAGGQV
jgi:glutamate:GABA antiporter